MEKVKVNKEIFDALENFVKRGRSLKSHLNYDVCMNYGLDENELILRSLPYKTLVDIAYCGYELELQETKEEKLSREYNTEFCYHFKCGIKYTLDLLGIKIDGINK